MRWMVLAATALVCGAAAEPPRPITMEESRTLSDEALTRRALALFDQTPATAGSRPGGFTGVADQVVQIHRPLGFMMPGGFAVGFSNLGLVLRAHPSKISPSLCEQPRLDLIFADAAPVEDKMLGMNVNAPKRPEAVGESQAYVAIAALDGAPPWAKTCAALRDDEGAIAAPDAETAWTGLQLLLQAKRMADAEKTPWLSCLDEKSAACRASLTDARAAQVFNVTACDPDDTAPTLAADETCLSVTGARQRSLMYGEGWRADIVYRPGAQRLVRQVRMSPWGFIV